MKREKDKEQIKILVLETGEKKKIELAFSKTTEAYILVRTRERHTTKYPPCSGFTQLEQCKRDKESHQKEGRNFLACSFFSPSSFLSISL